MSWKNHKRTLLSGKMRAYSIAAGAAAIGVATAAQGALQVFDYRAAPISASVEDNYGVWDHDMAVLYMDGTYKYSAAAGSTYTYYDENGVTTPIDAADKTDDAVWFTHHDFIAPGAKAESGYDGIFAYTGDGGVAANLIDGNENGNPLYEVYHTNDPDLGLEGTATQVDSALNYTTGGAVMYGNGGVGGGPGWGGSSAWGSRKGFGGQGFVGFYLDLPDGRHYGWVDVSFTYRPYFMGIHGWGYETTPYLPAELTYTPTVTPVTGDFDGDGDVDADDVDILCVNMAGDVGTYDMDGDGDVDEDDLTYHVENYLEYDTNGDDVVDGVGTFRGDFNADGVVNGTDLSILSGGFGTVTGFAGGNANCDATVNGTDLSILSSVFGNVATTAVPEPLTISLLALGACLPLKRRK